jgi:hypothetical protein
MRVKSPDVYPDNEISTLRSKIAELERREISSEEQKELQSMKQKHEKIA